MSDEEQHDPTHKDPTEMSFIEHLSELRTRMFVILAAVAAFSFICFYWASELFIFLTAPLHSGATSHFQLIGTGPAEAFIVKLKVAVGAGVVLSSPVIFYQIWKFVAPGLLEHEKKYAAPFILGSTFFFLLGISFCYYAVLPFAFGFFVGEFESIGVSPDLRIGEYLSFTVQILLVFGVVFELPIFSFLLAAVGILKSNWLKQHGRMAIVVIFCVAAILTPPDVITQCLLAVPLLVLYFLCYWIAVAVERTRAKKHCRRNNKKCNRSWFTPLVEVGIDSNLVEGEILRATGYNRHLTLVRNSH
jgi:sec-independent protein translocase protein TatC